MKQTHLTALVGNEPMGIRGRDGIVTALVKGKWYDSVTINVRGEGIVEAVDLTKPLTKAQTRNMERI